MTEKWRPSPAVLNGRRVRIRGFLMKRTRPSYTLGDRQPIMDSIWEWNKSPVEQTPHIS